MLKKENVKKKNENTNENVSKECIRGRKKGNAQRREDKGRKKQSRLKIYI